MECSCQSLINPIKELQQAGSNPIKASNDALAEEELVLAPH
jgi:hypothetical protein